MDESEVSADDVLNILVASDIHLGYEEKDPTRGKDSFIAFEEILSLAKDKDVDFLLLGGDLFHDAKPSQYCLYRALELFRRYCLGDSPVKIQFLSDQSKNFEHCLYPEVNYENENINIAIPVFSIHGNHDDPTGLGFLSSMDLLSVTGLINYFGKWTDLTQVEITPLLLQKGKTKLALYGLSYIKDDRLCRLFRDRKVKFLRPEENIDEWFNIFVTHQNRADRGINKSIKETALPSFLDVVIWGHEHDCRIKPEQNPTTGFHVIQPGSPVATSLCEGESIPKHVGILKVYKKKFELEPIKLRTVRPFVMETVVLSKTNIPYISNKASEAVQKFLTERVNILIQTANSQRSGDPRQPKLPLIRLRVEYNDEMQTFNHLRFGQTFRESIANPKDLILLKREASRKGKEYETDFDKDGMSEFLERNSQDIGKKAEVIVESYFETREAMKILNTKGLAEAVSSYINKNDTDAVATIISSQEKAARKYLMEKVEDLDAIAEAIDGYGAAQTASQADVVEETRRILLENRSFRPAADDDDNSDNDDDTEMVISPPARGRGRGRGSRGGKGPGSRGGRGSRARGAKAKNDNGDNSLASSTRSSRTTKKTFIVDSDDSD
ncbi:double-strand break repair protein MRE11 [Nilaparvata lugens]|uniref:double-strand break repair protein MRE11 n=1 Tax=Nilaparvata lugens TaxID=108931 RepID=UPI00193DD7AE|nr:double-strand break repair protein MRE11 [Nilaparvata lugens]